MRIGAFDPGTKDNVGFALFSDGEYQWSMQGTSMSVFKEVWSTLRGENVLYVCEDIFVGKGPRSSISLAKSAGEIRGAMRATGVMTGGWYWEPMSGDWRKIVGFSSRQPAEDNPSKTRRTSAGEYMEMSCELAKRLTGTTFSKKREHEADAVCIAYAGWLRWQELQRGPRQRSLLTT